MLLLLPLRVNGISVVVNNESVVVALVVILVVVRVPNTRPFLLLLSTLVVLRKVEVRCTVELVWG